MLKQMDKDQRNNKICKVQKPDPLHHVTENEKYTLLELIFEDKINVKSSGRKSKCHTGEKEPRELTRQRLGLKRSHGEVYMTAPLNKLCMLLV